jgi:penicillin-binding protein 1C
MAQPRDPNRFIPEPTPEPESTLPSRSASRYEKEGNFRPIDKQIVPSDQQQPMLPPQAHHGGNNQQGMGYPPQGMHNNGPAYRMPSPPPPMFDPNAQRLRARRRFRIMAMGCGLTFFGFVGVAFCGVFILASTIYGQFQDQLNTRLDELGPNNDRQFQTTRILDRNGNELFQLIDEGRRTKIKLAEVAPMLIEATIATEDSNFYNNPGVDLSAITRAGLTYFSGSFGGGASTITQQLIRNVLFDTAYAAERSARRKLEEILLALTITGRMSKDDILEMYLNTIYYGNLAYGIEAASQTYFAKSAKDLTLAEAALLAGLPQLPSQLDPFSPDPKVQQAVLARQRVVLDLMVRDQKITAAQAQEAKQQPLSFANPNVELRSPHFTLYARSELETLLPALNLPPSYITTGGLSVYTTLDPTYQSVVEGAAQAQIAVIRDRNNAGNAAVVVLKPITGEILAMMGSVDYKNESIDGRVNMAISPRQPGSAVKALTYAVGLERGFGPATVFWDVQTHFGGNPPYSPRNYDNAFHGPVRMREALARSYNLPAVHMLRQVGVDALLEMAERLGIQSLGRDSSRFGLALTLGGGEVSLLELTGAYSVFANEGQLVRPTSILCVINSSNEIVYQYEDGCAGRGTQTDKTINAAAIPKPVLDPRIAFIISDILGDNRARAAAMGANSPLRTDGIQSSVKTGTTNDYRDNWTVGFTRSIAVGVWVGNADNTEMRGSTGLTGAAPIWNQVMTTLYNSGDLRESMKVRGGIIDDTRQPPPGLRQTPLCDLGSLPDPSFDCQRGRVEWDFESPAMAPNAEGRLESLAAPVLAINGLQTEMIDPAVLRVAVVALPPGVVVGGQGGARGEAPLTPKYCVVPAELAGALPNASVQAFIQAPTTPDLDFYARQYAYGAGLAIMPNITCSADAASYAPPAVGVTVQITEPQAGATVSGQPIFRGTVNWGPGSACCYKMELRGPQFPEWTTFSGPIYNPVINADLGNFGAQGLIPGTYEIRIVVIGNDMNHLYETPPYPVYVSGQ